MRVAAVVKRCLVVFFGGIKFHGAGDVRNPSVDRLGVALSTFGGWLESLCTYRSMSLDLFFVFIF